MIGNRLTNSISRDRRRDILFDFVGVFIGVDAEIAELAALAAERDVQVQAQRRGGPLTSGPLPPRARRDLSGGAFIAARTSAKPSAVHCENGG